MISIIIPVYNGADYLRDAIDSALAQTCLQCEVLVINDGSDDGGATEAIARSYGEQIRYYYKDNGGVGSALNVGLRQMRGTYFCWLSHDDVYLPQKCLKQWELCSGVTGQDIVVYGDIDHIDAQGHRSTGIRTPTFPAHEAFCRIWGWSFLNGCAMLLPRSLLLEEGGFREDLPTTQDYDLWLRIARKATFRRLPKVVLLSRQHAAQGSRTSAHQRECATLFSDHVPALLSAQRAYPGGLSAGAPLLARAILHRIVDYGLPCLCALWRAFHKYTTVRERALLLPPLLRALPGALMRGVWLQLPPQKRLRLRHMAASLANAANLVASADLVRKFGTSLRDHGWRAVWQKTERYVGRVACRAYRALRAATAEPGCLPQRGASPLWIVADHDAGGGANTFRRQRVERLLGEGKAVLLWQYLNGVGCYLFEWRHGAEQRHYRARTLESALAFVRSSGARTLFVNSVVGWPRLAETLEFMVAFGPLDGSQNGRLEIFLHDYFVLCPAYPLLNREGIHCGVPMPPQACEHCLPGHPLAAPHGTLDIPAWREMWGRFLASVDSVAVADESVRALLARVYPQAAARACVAPLEPLCRFSPLPRRRANVPPVIGIVGTITRHKGAGLVEDLIQLLAQQTINMRVVVLGTLESSLRHPLLCVTGAYVHAHLPELMLYHHISVCLVPSPLPETFCYAAQEVEMLDLPLVCLDLGAQGARARRYQRGYVAQTPDAQGCLQAILQALCAEADEAPALS